MATGIVGEGSDDTLRGSRAEMSRDRSPRPSPSGDCTAGFHAGSEPSRALSSATSSYSSAGSPTENTGVSGYCVDVRVETLYIDSEPMESVRERACSAYIIFSTSVKAAVEGVHMLCSVFEREGARKRWLIDLGMTLPAGRTRLVVRNSATLTHPGK